MPGRLGRRCRSHLYVLVVLALSSECIGILLDTPQRHGEAKASPRGPLRPYRLEVLNFYPSVTEAKERLISVVDVAVRWLICLSIVRRVVNAQELGVYRYLSEELPALAQPEGDRCLQAGHGDPLVVLVVLDCEFRISAVKRTDLRAVCIVRELSSGCRQHSVYPDGTFAERRVGLEASSLEVGIRSAWSTAKRSR